MKATIRKTQILAAAMELADEDGYANITRDGVAARAKCAMGLVNTYYSTMNELRRAVMSEAIRTKNLSIIAAGIVDKHPKALRASDELKREALASCLGV